MMSVQTYLNEHRDELFQEVPGLITAEYYENPDRIVLVVNKLIETLPDKELDGSKILFEQMVLGGTVIQVETNPNIVDVPLKATDVVKQPLDDNSVFGRECLGPTNAKSRNKKALKAWEERHKRIKPV